MVRSFWVNFFFPLVIDLGTCARCRHLFILSDSLSWIEVNFLNQNHYIPSWPSIFLFDIFSSVLSKSMCISDFGLSSSTNSFVILFINSACLLSSLGCLIFVQNYSVSLASSCWYVFLSSSPHLLVEFSFVVLECPVLSVLFYPLLIPF